jgi:hypothetical protein
MDGGNTHTHTRVGIAAAFLKDGVEEGRKEGIERNAHNNPKTHAATAHEPLLSESPSDYRGALVTKFFLVCIIIMTLFSSFFKKKIRKRRRRRRSFLIKSHEKRGETPSSSFDFPTRTHKSKMGTRRRNGMGNRLCPERLSFLTTDQ